MLCQVIPRRDRVRPREGEHEPERHGRNERKAEQPEILVEHRVHRRAEDQREQRKKPQHQQPEISETVGVYIEHHAHRARCLHEVGTRAEKYEQRPQRFARYEPALRRDDEDDVDAAYE